MSVPSNRPRFTPRELFVLIAGSCVLLAVVLPAIRSALLVTDGPIGPFPVFDVSELGRLDQAMTAYKLKFGELPPPPNREAVIEHLRRIYPKVADPEAVLRTAGLDLDKLDSRESLVFWLGERPSELFTGLSLPLFIFEPTRLVDDDQDGYLEYKCRNGDHFGVVGDRVVIESQKLGRSMTFEDIERKYCGR